MSCLQGHEDSPIISRQLAVEETLYNVYISIIAMYWNRHIAAIYTLLLEMSSQMNLLHIAVY